MIYLDSCVVIPLTEAEDVVRCGLRQQIAPYVAQGIAISELTRLECRVYPLAHQQDFMLRQYDLFFTQPEIRNISFSAPVWDLATHIRAEHGLKIPDALHLAVAIKADCQTFCTYDKQLARIAEKFITTLTPASIVVR